MTRCSSCSSTATCGCRSCSAGSTTARTSRRRSTTSTRPTARSSCGAGRRPRVTRSRSATTTTRTTSSSRPRTTSTGSRSRRSKDHVYVSSKGKIVLDGPGGIEIKGGDVTVTGGKIKLDASGALEMKGASVKLEGTGETDDQGFGRQAQLSATNTTTTNERRRGSTMGTSAAVLGDKITATCSAHQIPNPTSGAPQPGPPFPFVAAITTKCEPKVLIGGKPAVVVGLVRTERPTARRPPPERHVHDAADSRRAPSRRAVRRSSSAASRRPAPVPRARCASVRPDNWPAPPRRC